MHPGEMNVDPIEGEFFSTEALGSLADALVREAIQSSLDVVEDPMVEANGYILDTRSSTGTTFRQVTTPVQFDEVASPPGRAPEFNEHGDAILHELGLSDDEIIALKIAGAVA